MSPYAIEQMANGSFVVMKIVTRTQAALPGRDVKLNAFRGSFATLAWGCLFRSLIAQGRTP